MSVSTRPLIGYTTRSGVTTTDFAVPRFANNESYARALADNGGAPLMIPALPNEAALDAIYATLDGLLLTGGPDVDPARYAEARHPKTDSGDAAMESVELYLVRRALAEGKPVLGICRGLQALNVASGGTLYQDLSDQLQTPIDHARDERTLLVHNVAIDEGTRLRQIVGEADLAVNSLHHQGIRTLAPGLVATAVAPDGLIEAIERPGEAFALAVQWHPEELYPTDPHWAALFSAFVVAARAYGERRQQP